jgi:hypothetical protein
VAKGDIENAIEESKIVLDRSWADASMDREMAA